MPLPRGLASSFSPHVARDHERGYQPSEVEDQVPSPQSPVPQPPEMPEASIEPAE
jgi:hypothetical protein